MKRFLIPAILMFILLTAWGCGNSDNILAPESDTGNDVILSSNYEADVWSEVAFLAAPKNNNGKGNGKNDKTEPPLAINPTFELLGYSIFPIGPLGGFVNVGSVQLNVPKGALSETIFIWMAEYSDGESCIHFEFGPHGTQFAIPAELNLSWASLKKVSSKNLILYYYDKTLGEWVEETQGVWSDNRKKATLYIDHFSLYYFRRR